MFFSLEGATTAGVAVEVSVAPVTAKDAVALRLPLVATTVMTRLERSTPTLTLALTTPLSSVVGESAVKVAPLSTENVTGTPLTVAPPLVAAVAVATTASAPELLTLALLSCKVSEVAVVVVVVSHDPGAQ
ncbi:MAG: hypothetical protein M9915_13545 [Rhizobacter sp.]|nr:hypothetical protein [Rhizobacter sp.]